MARFIGFHSVPTTDARQGCPQARRFQLLARRLGFRTELIGETSLAFDSEFISFRQDKSGFCLISGQFIHTNSKSFVEDFRLLVTALEETGIHRKMDNFLRNCRGNFCAVFGRVGQNNCYLATDCLATRPIFVWEKDGGMFFSGQLNLARDLGDFSLSDWDEQALLEILCFGIPLGSRTEFPGLSVLDAATVAARDSESTQTYQYRAWRRSPPIDLSMEDQAKRLHEAFTSSVSVRTERYGGDFCLLSGGMDSRAIAVTLRQKGHQPLLFNFGAKDSQDYQIATQLAKKWKARLVSKPIDAVAFEDLGGIESIVASVIDGEVGRPLLGCHPVWTGDGGSVCLGAVYLDKETIDLAKRDGRAAIANFVRRNQWVLLRAYRPAGLTEQFSEERVECETALYNTVDLASGLFLFLLQNDQRRHLWRYFENIHLLRQEPVTPFFDQHFLAVVDSCPVDALLYHRVYSKLFEILPMEASAIGWQTYPGHTPCSIPIPEGAEIQWGQAPRSRDIATRRRDALNIIAAVWVGPWPSRIQKRITALLIALTSLTGIRRLDYLVKKTGVLAKFSLQRRDAARRTRMS